jgi:hypothetical protein
MDGWTDRRTDTRTGGRMDGPKDAHGLLYAGHFAVTQAAISMSPPSPPVAHHRRPALLRQHTPYVRSYMLPSVGGPGANRLRRSRYFTPLEQLFTGCTDIIKP